MDQYQLFYFLGWLVTMGFLIGLTWSMLLHWWKW